MQPRVTPFGIRDARALDLISRERQTRYLAEAELRRQLRAAKRGGA